MTDTAAHCAHTVVVHSTVLVHSTQNTIVCHAIVHYINYKYPLMNHKYHIYLTMQKILCNVCFKGTVTREKYSSMHSKAWCINLHYYKLPF